LIKVHDVFHIDLLTPYKEIEEYGQAYTRPPPITVQSEEEYEVELILQARHKGIGDLLEYKVHWKGYPSADDSWVPHEDLHSPDLPKEFYAQGGKVQMVKRRREQLCRLVNSLSCLSPTTTLTTFPLMTVPSTKRPHSPLQTNIPSDKYNAQQYIPPTLYEPSQCSTLETKQITVKKNGKDTDSSYALLYRYSAVTARLGMPPRISSIPPLEQSTVASSSQGKMTKPCRPLEEQSSMESCKSLGMTPTCTPSVIQKVNPPAVHPQLMWTSCLSLGTWRYSQLPSRNLTSSDHHE
jgi:chromodomain-containing protein